MSAVAPAEGDSLSGEDVLILLGGRREQVLRWPGVLRYELDLEVQRSPWLGLADLAVRRLYPQADSTVVPVLLAAHCRAFAETTTTSYLGVLREFAEFCDSHEPQLLGLRGSALAGLQVADVVLSEPGAIRVRARVLKRALQPRSFADWVIRFDPQDQFWGSVVSLLAAYKARVLGAAGSSASQPSAPVSLFGGVLPGAGEALVDRAVDRVLVSVPGLSADVKATLSSHSLRIGACSCMVAIGVARDVIRLWFKWQSTAMIDTYSRVVQPEPWMERLYGWMKVPGAPVAMFD